MKTVYYPIIPTGMRSNIKGWRQPRHQCESLQWRVRVKACVRSGGGHLHCALTYGVAGMFNVYIRVYISEINFCWLKCGENCGLWTQLR